MRSAGPLLPGPHLHCSLNAAAWAGTKVANLESAPQWSHTASDPMSQVSSLRFGGNVGFAMGMQGVRCSDELMFQKHAGHSF